LAAAVLGLLTLVPSLAGAHAFQPALLDLSEREGGSYAVTWKVSTKPGEMGRAPATELRPVLPDACETDGPVRRTQMAGRLVERWTVDCGPEGLVGRAARIDGLEDSPNDVLVRLQRDGGPLQTALLNRDKTTFEAAPSAEAPDSSWSVASTYLVLGVEHILLGFDHLLFVVGLLLLVRSRRMLVTTITSFTVAHSVTLALSTLGIVALSQGAVEAVIALSLVLLAVEVVRKERGDIGWTAKAPWAVAFAFGLLHGFGFAGALREIGLPESDLPLALASFNVGVELGQLGFVAAWLLAGLVARRFFEEKQEWLPRLAAYGIGVPAAYWAIARIAGIFGV
jgi:hydrogenase/urease accessory protein HupE